MKRSIFKKRFITFKHYSFKNRSVFIKNRVLIELYILKRLLFRLKRIYKKKKITLFINLNKNHIISKKPKNSRMGKGKGKFTRYIYKLSLFTPILFFEKISNYRFKSLQNVLNFKNGYYI